MKRKAPIRRKARLRRFSRRGAPKHTRSIGRPKNGYESRKAILRGLGFSSYASYLASDLWRRIRAEVFERDGFACRTCGRSANVVHHLSYDYETMAGEMTDRLLALCRWCHERIEVDGHHRKRTLGKAREATLRMVEAFENEPA